MILFALTVSCGKVKIKDSEFCGDMGPEGATCFRLLSDESRTLTASEWEQERFGMICSKSKAFLNFKTSILKLCNITKRCTYEQRQTAKKLGENIDAFIKELNGEQNEGIEKPHRQNVRSGIKNSN